MSKLGLALGLPYIVAVSGACSVFDPKVGALRGDGSTCDLGASGYGTALGAPSGASATADFCTADGGTLQSACDVCEATSCCAQRVACYTAEGCSCSDQALDPCLQAATDTSDAAGDGGGSDAGAASVASAACWKAFSASGATEQARYACLVASCRGPCSIPN